MTPRRWRCTVCGYIHEGAQPPEVCPVCGADRSLFVPVEEAQPNLLEDMAANFRIHPVVAHFPCGLVPTMALFLPLALFFAPAGMETAIFWLLLLVVAVTPVTLASGLYAWQKHFDGRRAGIFSKKIGLALTLLVLGAVAVLLRYGQAELLGSGDWRRWLYLLCLAGMLACVVLLGHYGSKLVFQGKRGLS